MTLAQSTAASALTPGRSTILHLDVTESCVSEQGVNFLRQGIEVARSAASGIVGAGLYSNMKYWASGCWTLAPLQADAANLHESSICDSYIVPAGSWTFIMTLGGSGNQAIMQEVKHFAKSTLPGAAYGTPVPATGDKFLRKRITYGGSTDPAAVTANASFDGTVPVIPYSNSDVAMDRVGYSNVSYPANQGLFLRWNTSGTNLSATRYLFSVYFGQYGLVIGGNGYAELWEYCHSGVGVLRWVNRQTWRYAPEGAAPSTANSMAVFPHIAPDGSVYIAFSNLTTANAAPVNSASRASSDSASVGEHIYRVDAAVRGSDVDESPGAATKAGVLRIDHRRDLRMDIQVSLLAFQASGILVDDNQLNGGGVASRNTFAVVAVAQKTEPAGCTITTAVQDGNTGATYVPGTDLFPQAKFTFAGTGATTPILWGYAMRQAPLIETFAPGAFSLVGRSYEVTGYAGDPQTECASVIANDLTMGATRLTKRGYFSAKLDTTYTPPGASQVLVTLFRGVCVRPRYVQKGVGRTSGGIDPYWREYTLGLQGMWLRLAERVQPGVFRTYSQDPANPSVAWKVTSAAVDLLTACGFSSGQINIPDLGYRLWPAYKEQNDDKQINPQSSLAGALVHMLREELGCYLHFEPNAGANGQWILIFGTQPNVGGGFTPVYNFVGAPTSSWPSLPYAPASYAANTSFYEHMSGSQNPPDFNAIFVTTGLKGLDAQNQRQLVAFAYNPVSYNAPGFTASVDPNHQDCIGHNITYTLIAPHLECDATPGGNTSAQNTQLALNWTCRRYYDFLCHTQRLRHFRAPLAFIYDASIASGSSGGYRPLRFQDPISIDGDASWLIKSVKYEWNSDRVMTADYEAIAPFPGQHFMGHDGHEFYRRQARRFSQASTGMVSHSGRHGVFAPAAHREQSHLALPVVRQGFGSIQNADGSFHSIPGWVTSTGAAG